MQLHLRHHQQNVTLSQFLSRANLSFVFFAFSLTDCLINNKEPSLPYYLLIAGEREQLSFPRALAQNETQIALTRVWTQVANFISYNDKCSSSSNIKISQFKYTVSPPHTHYIYIYIYIYIYTHTCTQPNQASFLNRFSFKPMTPGIYYF